MLKMTLLSFRARLSVQFKADQEKMKKTRSEAKGLFLFLLVASNQQRKFN
jgi:hypothetical protein